MGFTDYRNYTEFDPTQLNGVGYPVVTGPGLVSNLVGFTGAQVTSDAAGNEWLYFVPWSQISPVTNDPMVQSTAARVRIGVASGSSWAPVDITCASGCTYAPTWEMYDVSLLTVNPAWLANAAHAPGVPVPTVNPWLSTTYPLGRYQGQSTIAGFQLTWEVPGPPPMVGFVPDLSQFGVMHNVRGP